MKKQSLVAGIVIIAFIIAGFVYLRPPLTSPTKPSIFDPDMVSIQFGRAPKDAELLFLGDSITQRWEYRPELWNKYFGAYKTANLGVGGSCVGDVLGIVNDSRMGQFHPKTIVLLIGTNDVGEWHAKFWQQRRASPEEVSKGIQLIVRKLGEWWPDSKIILVGIFPRFAGNTNDEIGQIDAHLNSISGVTFLTSQSILDRDMTTDGLHLNDRGYEAWGEALKHLL